ncbi:porin [Pontibaca methylaminivorans]|uniref:porin n=1 Tax=Pontibaca methylaminivorans TaxID=515897 RepID=UPI002FDA6D57
MKKVLFATTALIATAGVAAADVTISGYGRFGLDYNNANAKWGSGTGLNKWDVPGSGASKTNLTSRLRLNFDMSTETDAGVTLGAQFRVQADSDNGEARTGGWNGARFYASYGGLEVGVGNIYGAIEWAPLVYLDTRSLGTGITGMKDVHAVTNVNGFNGEVPVGGKYIAGSEYYNWDFYTSRDYYYSIGSGANGVEVMYSAGGFSGHLSYSKQNESIYDGLAGNGVDGAPVPVVAYNKGTRRAAAFISYNWSNWTVTLAAQDSNQEWEDKVFFAIQGDFGQYWAKAAIADNDGIKKYGLYGGMDFGAASSLAVWVNHEEKVKQSDIDNGRLNNDRSVNAWGTAGTAYGINYSYDLGGGASFEAGAQHLANKQTQVQAGVYFSF